MSRSDIEFSEGKSNTRKEWIENMIAESKKRKLERQKEQEEAVTMTQDLDDKWKQMWGKVKMSGNVYQKKDIMEEVGVDEKGQVDPYDLLLNQFKVDRGAAVAKKTAAERLKTDDEIAKEEKERLEKLESDRIRRMRGEIGDSGDDEEEGNMDQAQTEEEEDDEDQEGEEEESDEDGASDLAESESDEDTEEASPKPPSNKSAKKNKSEVIEAAKKEIPYTFSLPESYEELLSHLQARSPEDHSKILKRMIQCNHPSLGTEKARLEVLFSFLLQYVNDLATQFDPELDEEVQQECIFIP